ncbi:MAG: DUF1385 domain-containing protein [Acidobacteriota bacterium]
MGKKGDEDVLLGGQAVIEGVMMRSSDVMAVAVRKSDGDISILKEDFVSFLKKYPLLKIPILRGAVVLVQSLILGIKSLNYSAEVAMAAEEKKKDKESGPAGEKSRKRSKGSAFAIGLSFIVAFIFGLALFLFLPLFLTELLKRYFAIFGNSIIFNLADGVIRIVIFILYIVSISLLKDIRRIFQYHGAEHKVVHAYEAGRELTVEKVREFSTLHPRCGTSFLLFVMVIAILLFSFLPAHQPLYAKIWPRLALLPLIAGISYEVIRFSARKREAALLQWLIWPGLFFQKITTAEPTDDQINVAIEALKNILPSPHTAEIVPS